MRAKQPDRVVIMTAVQTVTDDTMHVSSYEALMRYSSILSKQALSALSAAPVMISFEVSPWTANDRDDETDDTMVRTQTLTLMTQTQTLTLTLAPTLTLSLALTPTPTLTPTLTLTLTLTLTRAWPTAATRAATTRPSVRASST